jgi:hypothetical protein
MGTFFGSTWPGGIIPYTIHANFTEIDALNSALDELEDKTNLRFVKRQSQEDYVEIRNHSSRCRSAVGRVGGKQMVGCAPDFGVSSIVHELGHACGMKHEQSRSDRDSFIQVIKDNIKEGYEGNFERISNTRNHTNYDFESIMHYPKNAFSVNPSNRDTIRALDPSVTSIGSTGTLRPSDIQDIYAEYPNVGVVRRSDSAQGAGTIRAVAAVSRASGGPGEFITAVRDADGDLSLIRWSVNVRGSVRRRADSGDAAGAATHIDIAHAPGRNLFVTVCRAGDGRLVLISWKVGRNGAIERLGDSGRAAGEATLHRIFALDDTHFVTASRSSGGRLLLISWKVDSEGTIHRLRDTGNAAGEVSEIALTRVRGGGDRHHIATTVRDGEGKALVIVWRVSAGSGSITRLGDSGDAMGKATEIRSVSPRAGQLCISCKSEEGTLLVVTFSVERDGRSLERTADSGPDAAGEIGANALLARPYGALSAVSDGRGRLLLIKWEVNSAGLLRRFGDSGRQAGGVNVIDICETGRTNAPIVTPVGTAGNATETITWDDTPARGELRR